MTSLLRAKTQIRSLSEEINQLRGHRAYLAEEYDNISQYALITFSRSSSAAGVRAKVAAGDFNNRSLVKFPRGTPVTVFSNHGQIEILSLGVKPGRETELIGPVIAQQYSYRTGDGAADNNTFAAPATAGNLLVLAIGARDKDGGGVPPGWQPTKDNPGGPSRPFTPWQYTSTPNSGADGKGDPMVMLWRIAIGDEQVLYMGATKQQWTMWEVAGAASNPAGFEVIFQTLQSSGTTKSLGSFATAVAGDLQLAGFTYESDDAINQTVGTGWTQDQQRKDLTTGGHPGTVQMHAATNPAAQITGTSYPWCGVAVNIPGAAIVFK